MSAVNKELVRRHFEEIFNRRNLAVADELMAEEYLGMPLRRWDRRSRGGLPGLRPTRPGRPGGRPGPYRSGAGP
jgi:hypothetical protein